MTIVIGEHLNFDVVRALYQPLQNEMAISKRCQRFSTLTCLFGSNAIKEIAFKYGYGCLVPDEMQKDKIGWDQLCKIKDPDAFDLLDKMLELDHTKRIKATEVL